MKIVKLKYILGWMIVASLAALTACDVHEWPVEVKEEPPVEEKYTIELLFSTDMSEVRHHYDTRSADLWEDYEMRYTLRAFPVEEDGTSRVVSRTVSWEYVHTCPVAANAYDIVIETPVDIPAGQYRLMAWVDFVKAGTQTHHFYNSDNFAEVMLHGDHKGSTDLRDAFIGSEDWAMTDVKTGKITVSMERPLAKYSFVSNDLQEFIDQEEEAARQLALSRGEEYTRGIDLSEYKVVFHYSGFMPSAFNLFTNKPNDAQTGVSFESTIDVLNEAEATMGFDYVFVNGTESSVPIILALYNKEGKELFMSNPIEVPVKRGQHTIMLGKFLTIDTSGGVGINPDFDGEYNYEVKY